MPRRPKTQATQSPQSNALPPIQHALSARQQREVLRYAANFGVDTAAVVREIQAAMSPALEHAVVGLVAASDGYEKARADHDRSLRARFRGVEANLELPPRATVTLAPADAEVDAPAVASFAHSGM